MDINLEVQRQLNILQKGVEEIVSQKELETKIRKSLETNTPLVIKLGVDPTGSDLHIGHAVPLRKLKQFQDLGHRIKFLIGTFTAKIGDPTGKSDTRPMLSDENIRDNIKTYLDQLKIILDMEKTEVVYNDDWLEKLKLKDVLKLLSQFTVAQMIQRDDFAKRLSGGKPVSLVEFMYPILQGYDSVAIDADIELGATEQKFNLLRGRDLQKNAGQEPQVCVMMPILEGLDGVEKMSKSLNNYIGITEEPNQMFGKIMSISDNLMWRYYDLVTDISIEDIQKLKIEVENGTLHPMECKKRLGMEVVTAYHNLEEAKKAKVWFENVFSKKNIDIELPVTKIAEKEVNVIELLTNKLGFCKTNSEARRLLTQGGFKINGVQIKEINTVIKIVDGMVIKAGKKNIVQLKIK